MQIKTLFYYSLVFWILNNNCFGSSLESQKKVSQQKAQPNVQSKARQVGKQVAQQNKSQIQLSSQSLKLPSSTDLLPEAIGVNQARLDLINQLQLLMIADDSQVLAKSKVLYPNLNYHSAISLDELVDILAKFWLIDDRDFRAKTLLEQAKQLNAAHPFYLSLKSRVFALIEKQSEMDKAEKTWLWINLDKPIQLGDSNRKIVAIRERLILLGDLPNSDVGEMQEQEFKADVFDINLQNAIAHFQARHGLKVDGIVGPNTLQWMNIPLRERAKLLARNFIRQEFWYKSIGDSYVLVNIPQFKLTLVHANNEVLESKVSVGRRGRKTPLIESEISSVVVNPGWNVPSTILRKDLLPKLKDDVNYLADKNYQVFNEFDDLTVLDGIDVNRGLEGKFPYKIYQEPGPENPLGRFKLHFDNPYSIYLHDTPTHKQFDSVSRAFSSGCVRVEKANEVARWLVASRGVNQKLWQKALNEGVDTQWLRLDVPMPIYIVYWTAWMEEQSLPQFRQDIYRWENKPEKFALKRHYPLKVASKKSPLKQPRVADKAATNLDLALNSYQ